MPVNVLEAYKTQNRLGQKRNSPQHIIIKMLNIQTKELIAAREKTK
jgi:ribosomal protein L35AE/L33A